MSGGKSSSSSQSSSPFASVIAGMASKLFKESNPTLKLLFGQMNEALKTGGVGAQIPIIQSAVTNMESSLSQSMGSAKDFMSRLNGTGTSPLGGYMLDAMSMAGQQGIATTKTNMAEQMISGAPGLASGTVGQSLSGMGVATGATTSSSGSSSSKSGNSGDFISQMFQMFPQLAASFAQF